MKLQAFAIVLPAIFADFPQPCNHLGEDRKCIEVTNAALTDKFVVVSATTLSPTPTKASVASVRFGDNSGSRWF